MLTRQTICDRLESLPTALRGAEQDLLTAAACLSTAKRDLEVREADLLIRGVEGANEAQRKARLLLGTLVHAEAVTEAQETHARAALEVRCLGFELRALETAGRLLGGDEE